MRSQWFEYKEEAIALRRTGVSISVIEAKLGVPRSTLSGWFRNIELTEEQRTQLIKNRRDGWKKAREKAIESHRNARVERIESAKRSAERILNQIELTNEILELAFAMLYLGEGSKNNGTSIASSDPVILRFVCMALSRCFNITNDQVRCELHLRMDQDSDKVKKYWSKELDIPLDRFRYIAFDKRTAGRPTYDHYKGVCVIICGDIAIQRRIVYLYTLFCNKVQGTKIWVRSSVG